MDTVPCDARAQDVWFARLCCFMNPLRFSSHLRFTTVRVHLTLYPSSHGHPGMPGPGGGRAPGQVEYDNPIRRFFDPAESPSGAIGRGSPFASPLSTARAQFDLRHRLDCSPPSSPLSPPSPRTIRQQALRAMRPHTASASLTSGRPSPIGPMREPIQTRMTLAELGSPKPYSAHSPWMAAPISRRPIPLPGSGFHRDQTCI